MKSLIFKLLLPRFLKGVATRMAFSGSNQTPLTAIFHNRYKLAPRKQKVIYSFGGEFKAVNESGIAIVKSGSFQLCGI